MLQAQAQVSAADDYITSRRGAVGATARTRLAEARASLAGAQQLQGSDAAGALTQAGRASQLAVDATDAAQRDVGAFDGGGAGFGGGSGSNNGSGMLGAMLGGVVLNSLLGGGSRSSGGFGGLGGLGGLLGGGLPNVGSVGAGNAAGLLGYCLKNRLLGQGGMLGGLTGGQTGTQASGAQSILQRLTGRKDVQTSPGFAAGQAGQVQAGNGQTLALGNLGGQVKTQLCNVVLKRAKAFL